MPDTTPIRFSKEDLKILDQAVKAHFNCDPEKLSASNLGKIRRSLLNRALLECYSGHELYPTGLKIRKPHDMHRRLSPQAHHKATQWMETQEAMLNIKMPSELKALYDANMLEQGRWIDGPES